ncbi:MAG: hypothetical protein CVU59_00235 [Deltaproteobacteria bacterium HGW-Deltaproteobacteria-17]|nr:MAG: hypothetical protein CVU59_00235 [Deltaproteobacteria bacterium HGW-Deltaproteobacteria-17]
MHEGSDAATQVEAFIERWQAAGGTERSNFQMFFTELCLVLGLPTPDPASEITRYNVFGFESAMESEGLISYLRPEYQNPASATAPTRHTEKLDLPPEEIETPESAPPTRAAALPWPKDPASQAKALADLLVSSPTPLNIDSIASSFTSRGKWKARLQPLLECWCCWAGQGRVAGSIMECSNE